MRSDDESSPALARADDSTGAPTSFEYAQDDSFHALLAQVARFESEPVQRSDLAAGTLLAEGRLRIVRRLGAGGMGVVYEAYDAERQATVALKTLGRLAPSGLYHLKQEFRALAELGHPNIVHLHELFADGERWFFTMDRVHGMPFTAWLRAVLQVEDQTSDTSATAAAASFQERLRNALMQLSAAVAFIHAAGKVHCDLKPSNVFVTPAGQVKVLDFGLAVDRPALDARPTSQLLAGTPAYLAPEQASGGAVGPASDVYALGVMLYEAWTGEHPFVGSARQVLAQKQAQDAPRASAPAPWSDLCAAMLSRDPAARPSAEAICVQLAAMSPTPRPAQTLAALSHVAAPHASALLGRARELALLEQWYAEAPRAPCVVWLSGESGIGKSALLSAFRSRMHSTGQALVLMGRCHELENVPYKGFDRIIDELSGSLSRWPAADVAALLPREVWAAAQLFPVLQKIPAVAAARRHTVRDRKELRWRAFAALSALLRALSARTGVAICVDDLQWVDDDTAGLLEYLLSQPEPLPIALILSQRARSASATGLTARIAQSAQANGRLGVHELELGPLSPEATARLAAHCLGGGDSVGSVARRLVREAGGNPFLVSELARYARFHQIDGTPALSLDTAIQSRLTALPEVARESLELLALVGRPLAVRDVAAALGGVRLHEAVDVLRADRLARSDPFSGRRPQLECYHDKLREWVSASLAPERKRALYAGLVRVLAPQPEADPELLAVCWENVGDTESAARALERGGDRAMDGLAFERAAQLYARALQLRESRDGARQILLIKHGDALVDAGRGTEAARAYLEAADHPAEPEAFALRRKAAYHLMTAGRVDAGREVLARVLKELNIPVPQSPGGGLVSALVSRARLQWRGLALRKPLRHAAPKDDPELEALLTVVQGWVGSNPFVVADMTARYARIALERGARLHAARALAYQGYLTSAGGQSAAPRAFELIERALDLTEGSDDPNALAFVLAIGVGVRVNVGRFREALDHLARPLELFETQCRGVSFERAVLHAWQQVAMYHLGELKALAPRARSVLDDARARGDLWAQTLLATRYAVPTWLSQEPFHEVAGRFEETERRYQRQRTYQWLDAYLLYGRHSLLRYAGKPEQAVQLLNRHWSSFRRGMFLRVQMPRAMFLLERAGAALEVMARRRTQTAELLALVADSVRGLGSTQIAYAPAFVRIIEAALAAQQGRDEASVALLASAVETLERAGLGLYAASCRLQLSRLIGGACGSEQRSRAESAFRAQSVREPSAYASFLVPGFWPA